MKLTFVETLVFTARWRKRADDEALRALQRVLLESPQAGKPIPGCGILRKLRVADPSRSKGKRGGLRVIYMHTPEAAIVDLFTVYGKDEADDLSADEIKALCALAGQRRRQLQEISKQGKAGS
jgi:mRNA-degrading endonuclease RelE of RelBE toxin-antitoxin system